MAELATDPARRRRMGELGRTRCLHKFDIKTTVSGVEDVYRSALQAAAAERLR